jgi:predicted kinase
MTQKMVLTRGLPASGKTTWAREQTDLTRINRDDIRKMLFTIVSYTREQEEQVTAVQHGAIRSALKSGLSVVIDDTNLNPKFVRSLLKIAQEFDVEVEYKDFINVSLHECIRRDMIRGVEYGTGVGEKVINGMFNRYIKGRTELPKIELPTYELKPYTEREAGYRIFHSKPWAVIVDIDGTVAKMIDRGPYDWARVGEDEPVEDVLIAVRAMLEWGYQILFTSGRDGSCYDETEKWLTKHFGERGGWFLLMRTEKDNRPDWIIKAEIFDKQIRNNYNIRCVFDDRAQVVSMWRKLGLTVMQVAEGDF